MRSMWEENRSEHQLSSKLWRKCKGHQEILLFFQTQINQECNSIQYVKNDFFKIMSFEVSGQINILACVCPYLPEEHTTGPSALAKAPTLRRIPMTVPFWLAEPRGKPETHYKTKSLNFNFQDKQKGQMDSPCSDTSVERHGTTMAAAVKEWHKL